MDVKHFIEVKCYVCHGYYEMEMPPAQLNQLGGYVGTCSNCTPTVTASMDACYDD